MSGQVRRALLGGCGARARLDPRRAETGDPSRDRLTPKAAKSDNSVSSRENHAAILPL